MWYGRNPFAELDDLPDTPRLGLKLVVAGLCAIGVDYFWPRFWPGSFRAISLFFYNYIAWILERHGDRPSLAFILGFAGGVSVLCGVFIFFRRGVWWLQERREENETVGLKLR
jgi:hypothetical protein